MPANPKYLTKSPGQKFAKLSAGILGGYIITALIHMIFALILPYHVEVIIFSTFTFFMIWIVMLIIPYLFINGWKIWAGYLGIIILLYGLYYIANQQNPFI
ncbi:hypothetical protein [Tenacibaculum piscium]|uniref:hypothetical protein n=1 Tax=Tenacibaculum piscium TaxID=1458515 RepID=UPI001F4747DC|nr:hypothetical protein [Tenacibaculum piscium]